jgi:hypothetical protein
MVRRVYRKNKICGNKGCNSQLLSLGDFMSINLKETVELFKAHGREKIMECLITLNSMIHGLDIFGLTIANLVCN